MDGNRAFESKQYAVAADLLKEEYSENNNPVEKSDIAYKIAECYRLSNQAGKAVGWYKKAIEFSLDPTVQYKYALMLKKTEKYDEAIEVLTDYAKQNPLDRSRATREIKSCKKAKEWKENPTNYAVYTLDSINSPYSDFAPVIFDDESLVFTSSRTAAKGEDKYGWTGENFSDIFIADRKDKNRYSTPKSIDNNVNTPFNEGVATFNNRFDKIYFTRCGSDAKLDDYCQIFFSDKAANGWSEAQRIELFIDSVNIAQPCLSPDGKKLYFSSDALEGFGDKDIYVSVKTGDEWGYPLNLGPEINTEGYEGFPFIHPDGTLYFASNGQLGMGGLDIFKAKPKKNNRFGGVENLQYPINTGADDFGMVFSNNISPEEMESIETKGFFSSSRKGGQGNDDIYAFQLEIPKEEPEPEIEPEDTLLVVKDPDPDPEIIKVPDLPKGPVYILDGIILRKNYLDDSDPDSRVSGEVPIQDAAIDVYGLSIESNIASRLISDFNGKFELLLEPATDYRIGGSYPGFFTKSITVSTKNKTGADGDTVRIPAQLILDKIFANKEVTLDNIYYDLDKWDIRSDAAEQLDILVGILYENPGINIEIGSHTDSRGSDRYNLDLSQKRALSVIQYLERKGIDAFRLTSKGYGETLLVNECSNGVDCSEEDHQRNRRTTFKVLQ